MKHTIRYHTMLILYCGNLDTPIHLSVHHFIRPSIHLFTSKLKISSICPLISFQPLMSFHPTISPSVHLSIHLFIHRSIHPLTKSCIHKSTHLSHHHPHNSYVMKSRKSSRVDVPTDRPTTFQAQERCSTSLIMTTNDHTRLHTHAHV